MFPSSSSMLKILYSGRILMTSIILIKLFKSLQIHLLYFVSDPTQSDTPICSRSTVTGVCCKRTLHVCYYCSCYKTIAALHVNLNKYSHRCTVKHKEQNYSPRDFVFCILVLKLMDEFGVHISDLSLSHIHFPIQ